MGGLRLAGVLWIIGGLSSGLIAGFVGDVLLTALLVGGAVVGLATGGLLIARPGATIVRWSTVAGVAWLIAFGALTLVNLNKPIGEMISGLWLTGFGVAGALVAYFRRASVARV